MAFPRNRVVRGPRRLTTWVGPADQSLVNVATGSKTLVASFDAAASGLAKPTLIRTRGQVAYSPQSLAADITISGAFGVCVVSDRAFTAGAASIPGPFTDAGWDGWAVWGSFTQKLEFSDATGLYLATGSQLVDSKGMRKVSDDETVVLMAESQTGALAIAMQLRLLFKLS